MSLDLSLLIFLGAGLVGGLLLGLIGVGMALVAVPLLTFALPRFGVPAEFAPLPANALKRALRWRSWHSPSSSPWVDP